MIEFLGQFHELLGERKVTLIWDGLPSRRSKKMNAWAKSRRRWLRVERLPGYAPDLNPVEAVWSNLKGLELANFCAGTAQELEDKAKEGLERISADTELCLAFLGQTPLRL